MKYVLAMVTLALVIMTAASCGNGGSNSNNVNGNWTATLTGINTSPSFAFTTTITMQNNGNSLSVTNLNFTTANPCFTQGSITAIGSFTLSSNLNGITVGTNGVTSGSLTLLVQSSSSAKNTLGLQGTVNNNTVTGTWTLTGATSGCTGSGTFTMVR
jgi:hypothetical protein